MKTDETSLTPKEVAERYGVNVDIVRAWIVTGELNAIDVSSPGSRRPRYRVRESSLSAFERKREVRGPPRQKRSRQKQPNDVIQFF